MAWSGRQKHRDRAPGARNTTEPGAPPGDRVFRITDAERRAIATSLRHIDEARTAIETQHDAKNRRIIRELRASADRIFDVINGLEEIDESA